MKHSAEEHVIAKCIRYLSHAIVRQLPIGRVESHHDPRASLVAQENDNTTSYSVRCRACEEFFDLLVAGANPSVPDKGSHVVPAMLHAGIYFDVTLLIVLGHPFAWCGGPAEESFIMSSLCSSCESV